MPELIVILIVLLVIPAGIILALVVYFASRRKTPPPPRSQASIQQRLSEIDGLRSRNLISEAEYEEKRIEILSSI